MTMFEPWEYRTSSQFTGGSDLTGYSIAAVDGDIGRVDSATYDTGSSYLVVDTGPWIFGRKVMLPAGVVERIDTVEKKVYVDRTKDQIKDAPEYDETLADNTDYRERLGSYYSRTYTPGM
ncbi:MAG: PRC-barrel domain containing protein [Jiangellaceae bacterium]|nr:PRC-barrel domain containing protein [Jiangellaceae bacterium]